MPNLSDYIEVCAACNAGEHGTYGADPCACPCHSTPELTEDTGLYDPDDFRDQWSGRWA